LKPDRIYDIAPSPDTTVVVNCAGRTRSIIGAQTLINAGIPNKVVALRAGTMGWSLAGYNLERGTIRSVAAVSPAGLAKAKAAADRMAAAYGVQHVDLETLAAWRRDDSRSLYVLDVPRLSALLPQLPSDKRVVLYSEHETRARLAAIDLQAMTDLPLSVLAGGRVA
jgi:rhodanese-related sulfurtransferase